MYSLEKKTAFITAGAQGIGRSIAIELARAGADIVIAQRDIQKVEGVVDEIRSMGRKAFSVQVDVTSQSSVSDGVYKAVTEASKIDILVNNAGYATKKQESGIDFYDFDGCYDVNLKGVWRVTSELIPHFKANKNGKIINIASTSGRRGNALMPAYSASKAAVISLTQSLARKLGPYNVNVNAICPGEINTEMIEKLLPSLDCKTYEDYEELVREAACLKSPLTCEDVANATVFFASSAAKNITGQALNVDRGVFMN